ncbi:hypothetical protein [Oceanobacillus sp. J11TS1]|uniref:hypothetical protein n=1 Tax=Oceanobacillus sp. J11TS1 TaxID=2807191 RepID=UPI001B03841E|nr:hypothetical protein [Oceanobacillus sp. J11TS1]GIO22457.1 hypothetical protein J11TS1_10380 [Oceanobacillus sp. J11TS1]
MMPVKIVPFESRFLPNPNDKNDCIVIRNVRSFGGGTGNIELAFPFHEDTPNFQLSLQEAMELRNAIDEAYHIKLIEQKENE